MSTPKLLPALEAIRRRVWTPPVKETSWQWAERNVTSIPFSHIPGPFRSEYMPAIRPVMEAIESDRAPLVVIRAAVQTIKSLSLELSIAAAICRDPAPTQFSLPQAQEAGDEMQMRLRPLLEAIPATAELIPRGREADKAKKGSILFRHGMPLWLTGSHPRALQRKTLRRQYIDEAWQWEGDRIDQAYARITAYGWRGKFVLASQGSAQDHPFFRYWESTNQAAWSFKAPCCGYRQAYSWDNLKFDTVKTEDGSYDFDAIAETVELECLGCGHRFPDTDETRRDLNESAIFVPANPQAAAGRLGFHVNALATMSWASLVGEYLVAKTASWRGDFGPLEVFHTKRLAGFFGEAEQEDFSIDFQGSGYQAADWKEWQEDLEAWPEGIVAARGGLQVLPGPLADYKGRAARLRVFTIDVQRSEFWGTIYSITPGGRYRLLYAGKILSWDEIEHLRNTYEVAKGLTFLDSGDQPHAEVYPMANARGYVCLRGDKAAHFPHKNPGRRKGVTYRYYSPARWVNLGRNKRQRVHHFSALNCRDILARYMKDPELWELPDDLATLCPEFGEQHSAQRRVKTKAGNWIWKTIGHRGEHLADCSVMAITAGLLLKVIGAEALETPPSAEDQAQEEGPPKKKRGRPRKEEVEG